MDLVNINDLELRRVVHKEIPFIEGAWVEFYDDTTVSAMMNAQEVENSSNALSNLQILVDQIKDWNLADKTGKLEVSTSSLSILPIKIIKWLAETQGSILADMRIKDDEVKKNSLDS